MQIVLNGKATLTHAVLALGMFDGVHIGHRVLLQKAKTYADNHGVPLVVCTFADHPLSVIAPERCPPSLTTFSERAALIEALGADMLFTLPFDQTTMNLPPENYIGELVRRFHPLHIVCGYNHSFGKNGSGTPAFLHALGDALQFRTTVVPKITLEGREVSSSVIRALLGVSGDALLAGRMLARPYTRQATVVSASNGQIQIAFTSDGKQDIKAGVYRALWDDGQRTLPVVMHVESTEARFVAPCGAAAWTAGTVRFLAGRIEA